MADPKDPDKVVTVAVDGSYSSVAEFNIMTVMICCYGEITPWDCPINTTSQKIILLAS